MQTALPIILFILGLILLIKGGDWFVDGATGIAHRFNLPEILIGATVVSIGTTLPEVMVSATAALGGQSETAYGNAIGSVICNTALIAAITIAVKPANVDRKTLILPVAFFFFASVFYSAVAYFFGSFSRVCGIILLLTFVVYMVLTVRHAIKNPVVNKPLSPGENASTETECEQTGENGNLVKQIIFLIIGAVAIAFGANLLVENGTKIATWLGVPESVIALTFVALGTSLPELITAITSLIKGHGALSLGNIIGANLFNLVLVSGMAITLKPFDVPVSNLIAGINASFLIDIPVMNAVMLLLTVPALIKNKLYRWQGVLLLVIYAAFCTLQFAL